MGEQWEEASKRLAKYNAESEKRRAIARMGAATPSTGSPSTPANSQRQEELNAVAENGHSLKRAEKNPLATNGPLHPTIQWKGLPAAAQNRDAWTSSPAEAGGVASPSAPSGSASTPAAPVSASTPASGSSGSPLPPSTSSSAASKKQAPKKGPKKVTVRDFLDIEAKESSGGKRKAKTTKNAQKAPVRSKSTIDTEDEAQAEQEYAATHSAANQNDPETPTPLSRTIRQQGTQLTGGEDDDMADGTNASIAPFNLSSMPPPRPRILVPGTPDSTTVSPQVKSFLSEGAGMLQQAGLRQGGYHLGMKSSDEDEEVDTPGSPRSPVTPGAGEVDLQSLFGTPSPKEEEDKTPSPQEEEYDSWDDDDYNDHHYPTGERLPASTEEAFEEPVHPLEDEDKADLRGLLANTDLWDKLIGIPAEKARNVQRFLQDFIDVAPPHVFELVADGRIRGSWWTQVPVLGMRITDSE